MDDRRAVAEFLELMQRAHGVASPEQRRLIRLLAAEHLSVRENIEGVSRIMGWV